MFVAGVLVVNLVLGLCFRDFRLEKFARRDETKHHLGAAAAKKFTAETKPMRLMIRSPKLHLKGCF